MKNVLRLKKFTGNKFDLFWEVGGLDSKIDGKWLDCACGRGNNAAQYFLGKGVDKNRYLGIDNSESALEEFKMLGCSFERRNIEEFELSVVNHSADVILCIETLEHLSYEAADRLLNGFLRVINSDGFCVITFPMFPNLNIKGTKTRPDYHHVHDIMKPHFESFDWTFDPGKKSIMLVYKKAIK